jgi:hypothetical protein
MSIDQFFVQAVQQNPFLVAGIAIFCAMMLSAILTSGGGRDGFGD